MDHQLLRKSYQNYVPVSDFVCCAFWDRTYCDCVAHSGTGPEFWYRDWDHPIDQGEAFEKMKLERGWRSYYQDNHHLQYKDERRLYHVKGVAVDCPDQLQHSPPRLKRPHQNSGSGMQAVFMSGPHPCSHSTSGSAGTGVFLPPGIGNAMEPTRKSGCSTVLLPAGVIQALKLHFNRMEQQGHSHPQQCSCCCGFPPWNDTMANNGNHYVNARQKRQFQTATTRWNQEMDEGLPQEGIY